MKRFFDAEMETLRSHLVRAGNRAIEQVRLAVQAVLEQDTALAHEVRLGDDELDKLEVEIDEEAVRYMALWSPVAKELRMVIVGMKVGHDLERVGDEATNIAKRVKRLAGDHLITGHTDIARLGSMAVDMLQEAIDSFLNADIDKAFGICVRDKAVDTLHKELYLELLQLIKRDPSAVDQAIEFMFISKSLERIADHATNIAEEVIYLLKGEDIRHTKAAKGKRGKEKIQERE